MKQPPAPTNYKYNFCRGLVGHHWQPVGAIYANPNHTLTLSLECRTCRSVRLDFIHSTNGNVLNHKRRYPTGYRVVGSGRSKAPFRLGALAGTKLTAANGGKK